MSSAELQLGSAPDLVAPVVGYRQWRVAGGALLSVTCDETWHGPTLEARCPVGGAGHGTPPVSACSCGVHAWYDQCPRLASAATHDHVAGAVVLWGAIELHARGMRAQHCRIVALALPLSHWGKRDRVVAVARRLGVPAVPHRDLSAVARGYGAPVPASLRLPYERAGVLPAAVGALAHGSTGPRHR